MKKFNLIVAVSENFGIGLKGNLPWELKSELKYFSSTTKRKRDASKWNAVIMGRKTFFGVPESKRPLADRLNIVLSTTLKPQDLPDNVMCCPNLEAAMKYLDLCHAIENVWIVGGSGVYKEAMKSPRCNRLYFTKIHANYDCDTFFPQIPEDFKEITTDDDIPQGIQEENNIRYEYKVYEKQIIG